jgi:hypothetical protein
MENKLKIIGFVALIFGTLAAALSILSIGIFFALLAGLLGMITSAIYVAIDTRYDITKKKITIGIIAMLLSSVPILLMLAIIILSKINL